jgi:hypothetical protein
MRSSGPAVIHEVALLDDDALSEIAEGLVGEAASMRHQNRQGHMPQQAARGSAHEEFPQPRVAIAAGDHQVGADVRPRWFDGNADT